MSPAELHTRGLKSPIAHGHRVSADLATLAQIFLNQVYVALVALRQGAIDERNVVCFSDVVACAWLAIRE